MTNVDVFVRLEDWYAENCDGDWEHGAGVRINSLDNPGWSLAIDLAGTDLEGKAFEPVSVAKSEHDWYRCRVEDATFRGWGGARNLVHLLQLFLNWSASTTKDS